METKPEMRFEGYTEDWEQRKLGDFVLEHNAGIYIPKDDYGSGVPIVGVGDIYGTDKLNGEIFRLAPVTDSKYLLDEGDLLYGESSLVLSGIAKTVCIGEKSKGQSFAWHTRRVKVNTDEIDPMLATIQINHVNSTRKHLMSVATQTALTGMTTEGYFSAPIKLPTVHEQQQIGAFFQNLDDTIALQQQKLRKLELLKGSLLSMMFVQPGQTAPEMRFEGYTEDWEQRKLSEITKSIDDGNWIESKDQSDSGIRLIQTGNVGIAEYLDKADKAKWISIDTFNRLNCKEVFPGDILISRLPEPAGRSCLVPALPTRAITAVDCSIVKTRDETDSRFLLQLLNSPQYFRHINSLLAGGTRQRVSRSNLEEIRFSIPDNIKEQEQIGSFFQKLDDTIDLHRRKLRKLQKIKEASLELMFPQND